MLAVYMGLFAKQLLYFFRDGKVQPNKKSDFIFYKIVDFCQQDELYTIQCIRKNTIIRATIAEIVFDIDILYGLHPVQACYAGIEYAKHLKKSNVLPLAIQQKQKKKLSKYSARRYGNYNICYQDRKGRIFFINEESREKFLMDPRDIAFSEEFIKEFDSVQAFHIGLLVGLRLNKESTSSGLVLSTRQKPYLKLVK
ncbi:MAG: hypothetical protein A3F41_03125 [Coxiella sp. RIFCSPHIGHO2_12_FULL_44_14]|nr:MAG: hypothetical protein A3F41_03125 [Coxiella sp. RIFCSPHIGHO2_12_FULL_44_14]